jgi:glycerol-3-phosphate dehydrogenase
MAEHFDVVVIGGGIHGVGVAQAAACDGYSVLVIEKSALANGSSSRSSKLIHGGLRYLEGFNLSLVRESLYERTLLLKLAPELVRLQPFHIPVYADTSRRPLTIRAGLSLYALLGGLRRANRFRALRRHEWDGLDGLETRGLQAVYRYFDAQTNDAGLTRAVMQSAIELGAELACPAEFMAAEIGGSGCRIQYRANGSVRECSSTTLVNAAGPWANTLAARIRPVPETIGIDLVQGAHLIMEGGLEQGCYYMEVPSDRRAVFLLPWGEHALLGTTETHFTGAPDEVAPLAGEEAYLLAVMQHYFPQRSHRVIDRFAGLRVLPAAKHAAFRRSREIRLVADNPATPRVLSIYGGKLTGYRATATKVMRVLQRTLPARQQVARTSRLPLKPV